MRENGTSININTMAKSKSIIKFANRIQEKADGFKLKISNRTHFGLF